LIADNQMRKRDERFKEQASTKPCPIRSTTRRTRRRPPLSARRLPLRRGRRHLLCPAGKSLYQNGTNCNHNGHLAVKFQGALRDCGPCTQRDKCLRKPDTTKARQVSFFYGKAPGGTIRYTDFMKRAIDSERGRALYGGRFATVEPVFGNIRHNKGLDRFTCAGRRRWIRSGSSTAWCTTSRSWRITGMRSRGTGQDDLNPLNGTHSEKSALAARRDGLQAMK
jgi:hypothetical protein